MRALSMLMLMLIGCGAGDPLGGAHPIAGELTIVQLDLPVGAAVEHGEAGLLIGADGTRVLIDVGNAHHDDQIREALRALGGPLAVDWVVLTHFHGDHVGAFCDLGIEIRRGVIHRGFVDVGSGLKESGYRRVCEALRGNLSHLDRPLCISPATARCDSLDERAPASDCPGLGTSIDLGFGAKLTLVAADGFVFDGTRAVPHPTGFGVGEGGEENGRSVVGLVEHGAFRYHFGGDLTGFEPDVESHLVNTYYKNSRPIDVAHAHHHARKTSSNPALVEALRPAHVVAGINAAYVGSPHDEVLAAWKDARFWSSRGGAVVVQTAGGDYSVRQ